MASLNGTPITPPPEDLPDPKCVVARAVYEEAFEEGDAPWDELVLEEAEALEELAAAYLNAHMQFLAAHGFRILPPGAVLRPKSDDEAAAMEVAVKAYRQAKNRKGGLLAGPGLILPKGAKH